MNTNKEEEAEQEEEKENCSSIGRNRKTETHPLRRIKAFILTDETYVTLQCY